MAEITIPRELEAQIVMKPESVAGTDILGGSYTTADIIPVRAGSLRFNQDPNEIQNTMTAGRLGRAPSLLGPLTGSISFSMYPRGRGVAYDDSPLVVPEWDLPVRGCRTARVIATGSGTESVTYQPTTSDTCMTVYLVVKIPGGNALAIKLAGAIGTSRWAGVAGGQFAADFTFYGALSRGDVAYQAGVLTTTPQYPTLKSAAFQIGSSNYAPCIANIGFDMGIVPGMQRCINAAGGVAGHFTADRRPLFAIDPDAAREADSGWWTALSTGSPLKDLSFQFGTTQYNRIKFRASANATPGATVQVIGQGLNARDGIMSLPTQLLCTLDSTDEDWAIVAD